MFIRRVNRAGAYFVLPFFVLYFAFNLFPVLFSLFLSFTNWDGIGEIRFRGWGNYVELFSTDPYFLQSIANTVIIVFQYVPLSMVVGMLLATVLHSRYMVLRRFFQVANFFPYIIAPVAVGVLFNLLFEWSVGAVNIALVRTGLVREGINWLGDPGYARFVVSLMLFWKNMGYCMLFYLAGLANIPKELYEAADIDGASSAHKFMKISLPLLQPVTVFLLITNIIRGLQVFDEPKLLLGGAAMGSYQVGGPGRSCLTAIWNLYDVAFGYSSGSQRFGYGSAIGYGLFLFIAAFSLVNFLLMRRFEKR